MKKINIKKIDIIDLVLAITVLILIFTNLIVYASSIKKEQKIAATGEIQEKIENTPEKSEEELAAEELEELKKMTERDRMEHYFAKFIKYIKAKKYTEAYNLLYPEFRENYFKTQEEFRDYAKKTYPSSVGFSYNNIERQGSIYVLMITVMDTNKKVTDAKSQRIVIQEYDFNDFVLSFQVI